MLTVLKLGGSLITDKSQPETVDFERLSAAISALAAWHDTADDKLLLVHGGGSFGHHYAARYGLTQTDGKRDAVAVTDVHRAMGDLNDAVLAACHDRGVEAVPVRPLSVAHRSDDAELAFPAEPVETLLGEEFVPVVPGDVIGHTGKGATILSGDEIVVSLARTLDADRVGLCSTVPGVLDDNDIVIEEISSFDAVASVFEAGEETDVTGGMAGKVRALLELDAPASIFGLDNLDVFLESGEAGTVVRG
jgi:isopentenyl phosphate kinase